MGAFASRAEHVAISVAENVSSDVVVGAAIGEVAGRAGKNTLGCSDKNRF